MQCKTPSNIISLIAIYEMLISIIKIKNYSFFLMSTITTTTTTTRFISGIGNL